MHHKDCTCIDFRVFFFFFFSQQYRYITHPGRDFVGVSLIRFQKHTSRNRQRNVKEGFFCVLPVISRGNRRVGCWQRVLGNGRHPGPLPCTMPRPAPLWPVCCLGNVPHWAIHSALERRVESHCSRAVLCLCFYLRRERERQID